MMENRSFDHFLGWLPGADGRQAGLDLPRWRRRAALDLPLAPDYQGCGHPDPDHSYDGGRIEFNDGACDGWLRAGANDAFAIGYYTQSDLSVPGPCRADWTTCDRYFAAILAETFPTASTSTRPRPTASTTRRRCRRCRRSGIGWPSAGFEGGTTSATCRSWRCGARSTCRSAAPIGISRGLRDGNASRGVVRRSAVHRRGERHLERRPPARRHPQRSGVPQPGILPRSRSSPAWRTRSWSSTTTSGADSTNTSRRRGADSGRRSGGRKPGRPSRFPRAVRDVRRRLRGAPSSRARSSTTPRCSG